MAWVEAVARTLMTQWGYEEIRTPIFEDTALFLRGVGETTDIVNKEMYRFTKSDRDLCLRPEGTAGVVRAFIEAGLSRAPKPVKLWYTGPMFRYERPQAGRQRQFHQLGVEVFGQATPETDAEVILLAWRLFEKLGISGLTLEINDIGTSADRSAFRQAIREQVAPHQAKLCGTCQHRLQENPFRILDCKVPECQLIYATPEFQALLKTPWTSPDSQQAFSQLTHLLKAVGLPVVHNPTLVRGLDYYNGPVFEITATMAAAKNTVCGGGRYDALVQTLGGEPTAGTGWALGMERLMSILPANQPKPLQWWVLCEPDQPWEHAYHQAEQLREAYPDVVIQVDTSRRSLKKQMEAADKQGANAVWIYHNESNVWEQKSFHS
ncbi:MAG: histidine--tRNA ligase [Vampirovibrionales bacterium]